MFAAVKDVDMPLRIYCHTSDLNEVFARRQLKEIEDRFGLKRELQWFPVPPGGYGALKRATKLLYRRGAANKLRALLRG